MKRFKLAGPAQRFLSAFGNTSSLPPRAAPLHRRCFVEKDKRRLAVWKEVIGAKVVVRLIGDDQSVHSI